MNLEGVFVFEEMSSWEGDQGAKVAESRYSVFLSAVSSQRQMNDHQRGKRTRKNANSAWEFVYALELLEEAVSSN